MNFPVVSKLEKGIKGGLKRGPKKVVDINKATVDIVKNLTTSFEESNEFIVEGVLIPASIVKGAISRVTKLGFSFMQGIKGVVIGAVQATMESGIIQEEAVQGAVSEAIYSATDAGEDIAKVAVEAVKGAEEGVKQFGGDTSQVTKQSVIAAFKASQSVGTVTAYAVKVMLKKSIQGAEEILKEFKRSKTAA